MMRSQSGIALVLVIWTLALLLVIAGSFIVASRADTLVLRNSLAIAHAAAAADAGVHRAVFEVLRPPNTPGSWKADGNPHQFTYDNAELRIVMRDESAKIDINSASDPLLKGLLVSVGLADDEATRVLDAIVDWRDPDTLKRPNGAEESDYRAAGLDYKPANAPFQAIEELQLVLGMRPETYARLTPMITVYSRQTGVNVATASREVLLAIPGVTAEAVDLYLQQRELALATEQIVPPFPQAGAHASPPNAQVLEIRVEARDADGTLFVREAVAVPRASQRRPVTFLAWREGRAPGQLLQPGENPLQPAPVNTVSR